MGILTDVHHNAPKELEKTGVAEMTVNEQINYHNKQVEYLNTEIERIIKLEDILIQLIQVSREKYGCFDYREPIEKMIGDLRMRYIHARLEKDNHTATLKELKNNTTAQVMSKPAR